MTPRRTVESRDTQDKDLVGAFTPTLLGSGTAPPIVTVEESGFYNVPLRIQMLIPGIIGIGVFQYAVGDGPLQVGIGLASAVILPLLPNVTVKFSGGTYNANAAYVGVV